MIAVAQLSSVPYLDLTNLAGRFIPSLCFYDARWRMWIEAGDDREFLIETAAVPAEACYFSVAAQSDVDLNLGALNFLAQRGCIASVQRAFAGLIDDLFNLSGSLAKIQLLERSRETIPNGLSRLATTEVEYIVMLCRSIFDLYQEAMSRLWDSVQLFDQQKHRQKLKLSYADMVTFKGASCDAEQIRSVADAVDGKSPWSIYSPRLILPNWFV